MWQKDKSRERALRAAGWDVISVTWDDITNRPDEFIADVRAALRRGGWTG